MPERPASEHGVSDPQESEGLDGLSQILTSLLRVRKARIEYKQYNNNIQGKKINEHIKIKTILKII